MTTDTDQLRELAINSPVGPYHPKHKDWDAFKSACTPGAILALLDELDRLRAELETRWQNGYKSGYNDGTQDFVRTIKAARLEGWRMALQQAEKECKIRQSISGARWENFTAGKCAEAIRAMQPPAEWGTE